MFNAITQTSYTKRKRNNTEIFKIIKNTEQKKKISENFEPNRQRARHGMGGRN